MQDAAVPRQIVFGPEYQGGFWINRFVPSIQQYGFFAVTEKDQSDLQGLPPHFWMYSMMDLAFRQHPEIPLESCHDIFSILANPILWYLRH